MVALDVIEHLLVQELWQAHSGDAAQMLLSQYLYLRQIILLVSRPVQIRHVLLYNLQLVVVPRTRNRLFLVILAVVLRQVLLPILKPLDHVALTAIGAQFVADGEPLPITLRCRLCLVTQHLAVAAPANPLARLQLDQARLGTLVEHAETTLMLHPVLDANPPLALRAADKEIRTLLLQEVRFELVALEEKGRPIQIAIEGTLDLDFLARIQQVVHIVVVLHRLFQATANIALLGRPIRLVHQ